MARCKNLVGCEAKNLKSAMNKMYQLETGETAAQDSIDIEIE